VNAFNSPKPYCTTTELWVIIPPTSITSPTGSYEQWHPGRIDAGTDQNLAERKLGTAWVEVAECWHGDRHLLFVLNHTAWPPRPTAVGHPETVSPGSGK